MELQAQPHRCPLQAHALQGNGAEAHDIDETIHQNVIP